MRWFVLGLAACSDPVPEAPDPCADPSARSSCSQPAQDSSYYADQGDRYFDTLDASADPASVPTYAELVARFEWPPWLKLTGYGREMIPAVDRLVLIAFPDTTVPERDCRGFTVQPFGRCKVVMQIDGKPCPIYEEFTFNMSGEVTFVEAWSDLPGLRPFAESDPWAEAAEVRRLSTRVPGLGTPTGQLDFDAMAVSSDSDVADFAARAQDFWPMWTAEYDAAGDDLYARGCGWTTP